VNRKLNLVKLDSELVDPKCVNLFFESDGRLWTCAASIRRCGAATAKYDSSLNAARARARCERAKIRAVIAANA